MYDIILTMDNVIIDTNGALCDVLRDKKFNFKPENVRTCDFNAHAPSNFEEFDMGVSHHTINQVMGGSDLYKRAAVYTNVVDLIRNLAENHDIMIIDTYRSENAKNIKTEIFNKLFSDTNVHFESHGYDSPKVRLMKSTKAIVSDNCPIIALYSPSTIKCLIDRTYNQDEYNNKFMPVFKQPSFSRHKLITAAITHAIKSI